MLGNQETGGWGRRIVILLPYLWLAVFFLAPFIIVLKISLSQSVLAQPPFTPLLQWGAEGLEGIRVTFSNFAFLFEDSYYGIIYLSSLKMAAISTALLFTLGYPIAYGMARAPKAWQPMLVMAVVLPFWTSFLIRIYAWINILQRDGLLNDVLMWLRIIDAPAAWLSSDTAIYIGIVYSYLPFMVLPLYASLERMDESLLEAASDLGCPAWKAFWLITFPLSLPGVAAGALLSFIPIVGEFVIPDLLGGSESQMIGQTLWTEFFSNRDWPVASAIAITLLGLLLVPILFYERLQQRSLEGGRT